MFMGNGEKAVVEFVGVVVLVLESGFHLELVDALYVPSLRRNLISISKLDESGLSFQFSNKSFSLICNSSTVASECFIS